jgi:DNA-binding transcriptional ArsR family regulator
MNRITSAKRRTPPDDADYVAALLRAVAHPARVLALREFTKSELSPVELTKLLDRPKLTLGVVAYHVRCLASAELIDLSHTIQRRGAIEHRYAITERGRSMAKALDRLAATRPL